ncbi:heavy-metal-associated domain-containing protein [Adhaeretor mobilis]|uniref:Heavy-metal-associated domain protein n=1 Tax=Adhaeretor mobilis TaxID=1930276 RepID=A0A517MS98_9BACT|nr:heavy-metal-associated domain-containing protein [Adhaeretor mobilis]QDS97755.1 Heavy-metal-associated domain protein [Adhaeretor mobilis]
MRILSTLSLIVSLSVTLAVSPLATAKATTSSKEQATAKPPAVRTLATKEQLKNTLELKVAPKVIKLAPSQTAVYVESIHCAHCAKKIVRKVITLKGVQGISTDVKGNFAIITAQKKKQVKADDLWKAFQSAGYQPLKLIGPEGTFAADKKTKSPLLVALPKQLKEGSAKTAPVKSAAKPSATKS